MQTRSATGLDAALVGEEGRGRAFPVFRLRPDAAAKREPVPRRDLVVLAGLVVLLAFLWGRGRGVWFWVDEGMSVGISSHPLSQIPHLLRQDGSPPLYYLLLHVWMSMFGSSEAATHLLSLVPALACVPAALWAGWSLFGRRTGWMFAALVALNPFIAMYANETRMYTLVVLLSLLATATFLHGFVLRRRKYIPAFVLLLAASMYAHNWGLLLAFGMGVALLAYAGVAEDRGRVLIDGTLAFAAVAVLYAPWVPTLLAQVAHTGAPFSPRPTLERVREDFLGLLGKDEAVVALGLGAGVALAALLERPWDRTAIIVVISTSIVVAAVGAGWLISRHDSVWVARYLAAVVGPTLLVLAAGLGHGGRAAVAALVVYGLFAAPIAVKRLPTEKSDVKLVAENYASQLRPGDLVVADFGRAPVLSYYLPPGLRYAEATGPVADERVSDQRDGRDRLRRSDPKLTLAPLVEALPLGGHVLVVCPTITSLRRDDTEFVKLIYRRCRETQEMMRTDPRLRPDGRLEPEPGVETLYAATEADFFTKVR